MQNWAYAFLDGKDLPCWGQDRDGSTFDGGVIVRSYLGVAGRSGSLDFAERAGRRKCKGELKDVAWRGELCSELAEPPWYWTRVEQAIVLPVSQSHSGGKNWQIF